MTTRESIQKSIPPYTNFYQHKDLIAFCVDGESFLDQYKEIDFTELTVIVEKDWLFELMQNDGVKQPLYYLQCLYTPYDAYHWYKEAIRCDKIAAISFD